MGKLLIRSEKSEHLISLSHRDIHLLDGKYFFKGGWMYREIFGLDFVRGLLKKPANETPLLTRKRANMLQQLQELRVKLETQRDLLSFNYSFGFEDEPKCRHWASMSGFAVEGGFGKISVRPAGYCDLAIMDVGPNGIGRVHTIIDLRVKRSYPTLSRGKLKIYARKAVVGWFDELDKLIDFLKRSDSETVALVHPD